MAWNWYPPVAEDTAKLPPRLHGHADMDIITLLYQRTGTCFSANMHMIDGDPACMFVGLMCHEVSQVALSLTYGLQRYLA